MLTADDIAAHPRALVLLRGQAAAFLALERGSPRAAAVFGTQQRYLLAQLALSMSFRSPDGTLILSRFLKAVVERGVASRNTAHDFVREMERYGLGIVESSPGDRRAKPLRLGEEPKRLIAMWLAIHLRTLDAFDGGARAAALEARPDLLTAIHPLIVDRIFASRHATRPEGTFSLFTWMNDGGLVMDKMIATIEDFDADDRRIVTGIESLDVLGEALRVTKTHLSRKMAEAEREQSLGWTGRRGRSRLWLSPAFLDEYVAYQADKLARIDDAYGEASLL
jgi:hypothetical protein